MVSKTLLSIAMRGQFNSENMLRGVATLRLLVKPRKTEVCDNTACGGGYLMRLLRSTEFPPYQIVACHSPRLDDKRTGTNGSRLLIPDTRDKADSKCEEYAITHSLVLMGEDLSIEEKDSGDDVLQRSPGVIAHCRSRTPPKG